MAKKKRHHPGSPVPARVAQDYALIEQELDGIETAVEDPTRAQAQTRLDQLFRHRRQLPEVLFRRLLSGRTRHVPLMLGLLDLSAAERSEGYLRRILAAPESPDPVRYFVRQRMGWPIEDEVSGRRAFLGTLRDAPATLVEAVHQASASWPPDGNALTEVLNFLEVLPATEREPIVTRMAADLGAEAGWLLRALLHNDFARTARRALDGLLAHRPPGAEAAVRRLAETASNTNVRRDARKALQRLAGEPAQLPAAKALPPLDDLVASVYDLSGAQTMWVVRTESADLCMFANFLCQDGSGLVSVLGLRFSSLDVVDAMQDYSESNGPPLIGIELAAARAIIAEALEENARSGEPVPPEFEFWEPVLHDSYPPPAADTSVVTSLDDTPYAGRHDLIERSGELAEHVCFIGWAYDSEDVWRHIRGLPPPLLEPWTAQDYAKLTDRLVNDAEAARLRRLLGRQAWLLEQEGEEEARDVALAVAAALAASRRGERARIPFILAIIERSIAGLFSGLLPDDDQDDDLDVFLTALPILTPPPLDQPPPLTAPKLRLVGGPAVPRPRKRNLSRG